MATREDEADREISRVPVAAEFWDFSVRFYSKTGVARACLICQDQAALDVNIILLCCWHAMSGRGALDSAQLARLEATVASWRQSVLLPLRAVRRAVKAWSDDASGALASNLAEAELSAEKQEQAILIAALQQLPPEPKAGGRGPAGWRAAQASLASYFALSAADLALAAPLLRALQHED